MQVANTGVGDGFTIGGGGWVLEDDSFLDVALHLPKIAGMGLIDVDDEERDTVFILLVKLVERGNLPAKGRSSVAPENEDNGSSAK